MVVLKRDFLLLFCVWSSLGNVSCVEDVKLCVIFSSLWPLCGVLVCGLPCRAQGECRRVASAQGYEEEEVLGELQGNNGVLSVRSGVVEEGQRSLVYSLRVAPKSAPEADVCSLCLHIFANAKVGILE